MRKSIATVSVSGTLDEKLAAISAAKFDGVELFDQDLVSSPLTPTEVAARCADLGLSIELFQPIRDVEGVDPADFPAVLRRVSRKLDVMEELGVTTLLACSNATPSAVDDTELSVEQLRAVGDLAQERGFLVAFEALAWGTHVNRVGAAWSLVEAADHPAVGLAVDTFHLLARGDDASALEGVPGDRIAFLQIADAPHLRTDVLEWSRHHRCFPGQGTLDVASVVAAVVEAGYRGPLSLEVFSDLVREASAQSTALDAMRSLLHLEEELRLRWRSHPEPLAPSGAPRVCLFDPPPAPASLHTGFVEIAVAPGSDASGLPRLLQGMGFGQVGTHRSKPVTWWRNGDAHVLLNAASDLSDRRSNATERPSVTSLGLEVDDLAGLAHRRDALLWPTLPLRRGPGEVALVGVDAPAGVHLVVSGTAGATGHWPEDFLREEPALRAEPSPAAYGHEDGGWLGIDHVGYAVPFDLSDAELSFHRTLFGLTAGAVSEFMDPHGRLRSRVIRRPEGLRPSRDPQIVLNVIEGRAVLQAAGINQVAFGCSDILAAVRRMRTSGVGLLEIPDNYYADLEARFDLTSSFVDSLREHGVLYDRDSAGGELLHVYTHVIGGHFYVEVLQRIGDYRGFGSPNTPVRLAAQTAAQKADARPVPLPNPI